MIFRGLNEKCKSQRFHGTISQNNYQKYSKVPNKVQFDVINFISNTAIFQQFLMTKSIRNEQIVGGFRFEGVLSFPTLS